MIVALDTKSKTVVLRAIVIAMASLPKLDAIYNKKLTKIKF